MRSELLKLVDQATSLNLVMPTQFLIDVGAVELTNQLVKEGFMLPAARRAFQYTFQTKWAAYLESLKSYVDEHYEENTDPDS